MAAASTPTGPANEAPASGPAAPAAVPAEATTTTTDPSTATPAKPAVEEVPGLKVFVGNLAYSTKDEGLKAFFEPVQSDVESVQVIYRGNRSAGYGFVSFKTAEAAQKAVAQLDKKELDGRNVIVEVAKPAEEKERAERRPKKRNGRRGAKPATGEVSEAEANGTAEAKEPEVKEKTDGEAPKPKKKKRNVRKKVKAAAAAAAAAVVPGTTDTEAAPAAATATGDAPAATTDALAATKKPRAPRAPRPPRPAGEAPTGPPSKSVLFVANLGFSIDDAALSELFTSNGITVKSARVVRRHWGHHPRRSKGYGFVDVGDEEAQKLAIEKLQGKEVGGREIAVKVAVNSQEREAKEGVNGTEKREESPEAVVVAS